jgi:hypothetical protein
VSGRENMNSSYSARSGDVAAAGARNKRLPLPHRRIIARATWVTGARRPPCRAAALCCDLARSPAAADPRVVKASSLIQRRTVRGRGGGNVGGRPCKPAGRSVELAAALLFSARGAGSIDRLTAFPDLSRSRNGDTAAPSLPSPAHAFHASPISFRIRSLGRRRGNAGRFANGSTRSSSRLPVASGKAVRINGGVHGRGSMVYVHAFEPDDGDCLARGRPGVEQSPTRATIAAYVYT